MRRAKWLGPLLGMVMVACNAVDDTVVLLTPPSVAVPDGGIVNPPDAGPPPDAGFPDSGPAIIDAGVGADDGEPCVRAADCASGQCRRGADWPAGYCTRQPCADNLACLRPTSICVEYIPQEPRMCATQCVPGTCRPGYTCQDRDGRGVCLPPEAVPPTLADGEACTTDDECLGGTCLQAPDWPGGHCTTLSCEARGCASPQRENNICAPDLLDIGEFSYCLRICEDFSDCREGYACIPVVEDISICVPDVLPPPPISPEEIAGLDMQCGLQSQDGALRIDFDVALDTTSYIVAAFARDGRYVLPQRLVTPARTIDYTGANAWQVPLTNFISPVLVPQTPNTQSQLASGTHRLEVSTNSQDVCWYMIEESTDGVRIDVQVHLVGLRVNAASAPNDPDLQSTLQTMGALLGVSGVSIGDIEYVDASASVARQYAILRSYEEFYQLVATSEVPGAGTRDDLLTLHLFFIQGFVFPDGGPLGISSGLPGPAGLHGTRGSGVVASAEFLGASFEDPSRPGEIILGSEYTGMIIAHEVGHYLGLFHTSEIGGDTHDHLDDTAECRPNQFPERCPDLGNLMFPIAYPQNLTLSEDQAHTVRKNPLSKD